MLQAPSLLGVAFFPPHGGGFLPVRNTFIHFEDGPHKNINNTSSTTNNTNNT